MVVPVANHSLPLQNTLTRQSPLESLGPTVRLHEVPTAGAEPERTCIVMVPSKLVGAQLLAVSGAASLLASVLASLPGSTLPGGVDVEASAGSMVASPRQPGREPTARDRTKERNRVLCDMGTEPQEEGGSAGGGGAGFGAAAGAVDAGARAIGRALDPCVR